MQPIGPEPRGRGLGRRLGRGRGASRGRPTCTGTTSTGAEVDSSGVVAPSRPTLGASRGSRGRGAVGLALRLPGGPEGRGLSWRGLGRRGAPANPLTGHTHTHVRDPSRRVPVFRPHLRAASLPRTQRPTTAVSPIPAAPPSDTEARGPLTSTTAPQAAGAA